MNYQERLMEIQREIIDYKNNQNIENVDWAPCSDFCDVENYEYPDRIEDFYDERIKDDIDDELYEMREKLRSL